MFVSWCFVVSKCNHIFANISLSMLTDGESSLDNLKQRGRLDWTKKVGIFGQKFEIELVYCLL